VPFYETRSHQRIKKTIEIADQSGMATFALLLAITLGASVLIDRSHETRPRKTRSNQGFAVIDLLVLGLALGTFAAFVFLAISNVRAL
jgi:hypothetical protein